MIIMIITRTGCCSDLTASAAEIEPTLDRWTGRPGNGPDDDDDHDDDDDDVDGDDDDDDHDDEDDDERRG